MIAPAHGQGRVRPGELTVRRVTGGDAALIAPLIADNRLEELRRVGMPVGTGAPDRAEDITAQLTESGYVCGYFVEDRRGVCLMLVVYSQTEFPGIWSGGGLTAPGTADLAGLGTAGAAVTLDRLFAERPVRRLIGYVSVRDERSRRLLDRLGFRVEARLRDLLELGEGCYCDAWLMSLMREEWLGAAAIDVRLRQSILQPVPFSP